MLYFFNFHDCLHRWFSPKASKVWMNTQNYVVKKKVWKTQTLVSYFRFFLSYKTFSSLKSFSNSVFFHFSNSICLTLSVCVHYIKVVKIIIKKKNHYKSKLLTGSVRLKMYVYSFGASQSEPGKTKKKYYKRCICFIAQIENQSSKSMFALTLLLWAAVIHVCNSTNFQQCNSYLTLQKSSFGNVLSSLYNDII